MLRADVTGIASLEVVRLLNRMIKERKFNVHPEVLSCLVYLRLQTELGVRASDSKVDRPEENPNAKGKGAARHGKVKSADRPHLSKKAKKVLKEKKEIEKEMREAAAEVDKEERAANVRCLFLIGKHMTAEISGFLANRNAQATIRPLFPYIEEPSSHTPTANCSQWNFKIFTLGQHRFLQRPHEGVEGIDISRSA